MYIIPVYLKNSGSFNNKTPIVLDILLPGFVNFKITEPTTKMNHLKSFNCKRINCVDVVKFLPSLMQ